MSPSKLNSRVLAWEDCLLFSCVTLCIMELYCRKKGAPVFQYMLSRLVCVIRCGRCIVCVFCFGVVCVVVCRDVGTLECFCSNLRSSPHTDNHSRDFTCYNVMLFVSINFIAQFS